MALLAISIIAVENLTNSRAGNAWFAIKGDEIAAQSIGINTHKYKLMAFAISATLAGACRSLFASYVNYIDSTSFTFETSILILSMTIMGEARQYSRKYFRFNILYGFAGSIAICSRYRQIVYGGTIILAIMFKPDGILGGFNLRQIRLFENLERQKAARGRKHNETHLES